MDLRDIGCVGVEVTQLVEVRDWWRALVYTVMKLRLLAPRS
jgi:hypothetical protein